MSQNYFETPRVRQLMEAYKPRISLAEKVAKESGKAPLNLERKAALAVAMSNTNNAIRLYEATQSKDIGQYKRFALDLVGAALPNLLSFDLVSVQAIDNRIGMINYLKFLYDSDKGSTAAGTQFNSSLNMGPSDPNYTSDYVDMEILGDAGEKTYTGNLSWWPVVAGNLTIATGATIITDDGAGNLKTGGATVGTIDYTNGAYTFTLANNTTEEVSASYSYGNEHVPSRQPGIKLQIASIPVIAKTRRLKALWAFESGYELQKEYGMDIQELLAAQAAGEISHEIDQEIMADLYHQAGTTPFLSWSVTPGVGVSQTDHYQSFVTTLNQASNQIYGATRRNRANWIICGLDVATVIESIRTFQPVGTYDVNGPYYMGQLGAYKVYVNPDYPAKEFVMGFKGDDMLQAGYFYCPYLPITTTEVAMLEDMVGRKGWATSYAKKMVNNQLYTRGTIV